MIIDLSHAIISGMVTYPGLAAGVSFEIESLTLAGNTGTYIDSPLHGWARHWGTPRYTEPDCPHLSADAVMALVDAGSAVVGIDSLNIDDGNDPARPARQGLLGVWPA